MAGERFDCGGFSLCIPGDWRDTTDDCEPGSPVTLALPDGVGALQFSIASYISGPTPDPSSLVLEAMLAEFAASFGLAHPRDQAREDAPRRLAATTFTLGDSSVRVWYLSDGRNFAKATYTWDGLRFAPDDEPRDCEVMVRSIIWT
jgi:hypothetical protein